MIFLFPRYYKDDSFPDTPKRDPDLVEEKEKIK